MTDLRARLSALSPVQRALLEARLARKKLDFAEIARKAEERSPGTTDAAQDVPRSIPRIPAAETYPLSIDQERIYFIHHMVPGSPFYNIYSADRFRGSVDLGLLRRALTEIVRRHENLRTRFATRDGRPVQIVEPPRSAEIPLIDMRAIPERPRRRETDRLVTRFLKTPFVLDRLPLCRTMLVRLGDEEYVWPVLFHHIVIDWVSSFVFRRELAALYDAFGRGEPSPLPPLPVQYRDYAAWQRRQLAGETLAPQREYWRRHLEGAPHSTELPVDRPRPAIQTGEGKRRPMYFPAADCASLRRLARREGVTLFMALLALYEALVVRLTSQTRVIVGSPMSARPHPDLEGLIGYFLYQTVFYADLGGDPGFVEALRRVRTAALGAFGAKDVPFGEVVRLVDPERDTSRMPLTQLTFLYLDMDQFYSPLLPGIELLPYEFDGESSKFDMTLALWDREEIGGFMEYNSDLFDAATVDRFGAQMRRLLAAALDAPERPLSQLALLSPGECHELVAEWNDTAAAAPAATIHELVAARAEATPESPAVVCGGEELTYAELRERAALLARELRRRGVGPETRVGVLLERSVHLPAALLGVLAAGGAYVPLDPSFPGERLAFMLADSGARLLLTEGPLAERVPTGAVEVLTLDGGGVLSADAARRAGTGACPYEATPVNVSPENAAYVIYTSGSTGRPKGVVVPHAGVVAFLRSMAREPGLGPTDCLAAVTTLSFDIAALELFLPLTVGARVAILGRAEAADPKVLARRLAAVGATVMQATPATWQMLLDAGWDNRGGIRALCGGEALPPELARRLAARAPAVWNLYGPTETTIWSSLAVVAGAAPIRVGRAIGGTRLHVLDRWFRPAAIGAAGELAIGGRGVTRGYHGRPALTAAAFVPDAFAGEAGSRLYRTGDRARFDAAGSLDYLGRADHQVKVRGFRIELGELEAALDRHPAVRRAAAGVRRDGLVAWVTAAGGAAPELGELRSFLAETLPAYMLPSAVAVLAELPLTASGKVDRKALPDPDRPVAGAGSAAPRTPLEEALAGLWCEVLEIEAAGVFDSFFELGGHSLLATQLASRIFDAYQVEVPLVRFFAEPTIAGLAAAIEELGRVDDEARRRLARAQTIPRRAPAAAYPLSFAQQRLWFLHELSPASPYYNMPQAVRLAGELELGVLAAVLQELVRRHEALRTSFHSRDGEPMQVIAPAARLDLPCVDLSLLPASLRREESQRLGEQVLRRPFALDRAPLVRLLLLRHAVRDHLLFLSIHHIVTDGWSHMVIMREVGALYEAFSRGLPSPLEELEIQYADFAVWQRGWLAEEVLEAQLDYWLRRMAGAPELLELPADRPRPPVQSLRGERLPFALSAALTAELEALAEDRGVLLYVVLLAAFQTLLHRYTGRTDLVVGSPIANRHKKELEGVVGFFVNMLLARNDLAGDPPFAKLLERVARDTLAGYDHQDVPFERVVEALRPERRLSYTPLFQLMFNLLNFPLAAREVGGLVIDPWNLSTATSKYDLSLYFLRGDRNRLAGFIEYSTDLFDEATVRRMSSHLANLLAAALGDPDVTLAELPLLAAAERHELLVERNAAPPEDAAPPRTIHGLFEASVDRAPQAPALAAGGEALTYAELDRRANALAHRLRRLGVGPEERVGVALERSADMVVALLGVLKAGGAYVPMDPSYPPARLALMTEDARPRLCLDRIDAAGESTERLPPTEAPGRLAYVIYTSGSTGRPKGVAVAHEPVVNFLRSMSRRPGLAAGDVLLSVTTLSFDIAGLELFLPLAVGAQVVVASREEAIDPHLLLRRLASSGATAMQATPATWGLVVRAGGPPPDLKVLCGGEALPPALAERLIDRAAAVWNLYGPTETTIWSSVHRVEQGRGAVALGRPIAGTAFYLLERRGRLAPLGVPGELWIGGAGLARGYLRRPALTAERFAPDAFAARPGARLYRTGDLVRYRAHGGLEFLGRIDTQVKVRGFRIELGEVEAALERHPAVRKAVVAADRQPQGADRLVAWLLFPEGTEPPPVGTLRAFLRSRLPGYMVPGAFVFLDGFPLTPSGKVDRAALARVRAEREPRPQRAAAAAFREPATPLERALARAWAEILGVERIGTGDRFFDLGGNSIQAAIFVNRLQRELGEIVHVTALFQAQSIAELVAFLEREYPRGLERWHRDRGLDHAGAAPREEAARASEARAPGAGIDAATIREMRRLAAAARPARAPRAGRGRRNPRAVFVLSPPRSGSTLLRVMLAGHPRLFSPPELELLAFDTLGRRAAALSGPHAFAREGLLRAVMELRGCDAGEAAATVARHEEEDLAVGSFYGLLGEWSGGRTLVDKTSTYALDPAALARAEELFEEPLYIHLTRHPCATVKSYVDVRLDQFLRFATPFTARQQAELLWVIGHQNVLRFLRRVPEQRHRRLRFEDLVTRPEETVRELCRFLGLDFVPAMLSPYAGSRMTDGLHPESRMHGDPRFHEHSSIEPTVAEKWRGAYSLDDLAGETRGMMEAFGYLSDEEEPGTAPLPVPMPRRGALPLSFSQHRQWFLVQLEPDAAAYNIPLALPLARRLDPALLEASFNAVAERHEALRTRFESVAGEPFQVIEARLHVPLPVVDLRRLAESRREGETRRQAELEAHRPFDLARPPLLRTRLLRLGRDEHLLLVTLHHIVADGWSLGLLVGEVSELYAAHLAEREPKLPELPLQYADYALWQRQWLAGAELEARLGYWRGRLAAAPPVLDLPFDRPRGGLQSFRGARRPLRLGGATGRRLRELARGSGATLFMALVAGFETLLHRYSGQTDFCLGTYVANRHLPGIENLIGFFVNTLALRAELAGNPGFDALLERVRETTLGAFAHQDLPFEKLLEEIQPQRDLSHTPLFQVMLVLQNLPVPAADGAVALASAVDTEALLAGSARANFDLTLWAWERGEEVRGQLEYNVDLFDHTTATRLLGHLENLFDGVLAAPGCRLAELPLLAAAESFHLLFEHNDSATAEPVPLVPRCIEARAGEAGDAVAVVDGGERLSYRELAARSGRLAAHLRRIGVDAEVPVALFADRAAATIVGMLGVWKAGGAYVPLDPRTPGERVAFVLRDTRAPVVLTDERHLSDLPPTDARVVRLDAGCEPAGARVEPAAPEPDNAAYVIYTSGSTGTPKGVVVTHRSLAVYVRHAARAYAIASRDRVLQFASLAFDASAEEIYPALARGAALHLRSEAMTSTVAEFLDQCRVWGVTVLDLPTAYWHEMAAEVERTGAELPEAVRLVILGGEAALPERLAAWRRRLDGAARLVNTYGPTEGTIVATRRELNGLRLPSPSVPLGRPVANVGAHLLDRRLAPVPLGVAGEIHLSGAGLARGYLDRPGLTAARFVPDPLAAAGRLYKTGDLARRLHDGDLEFLGRNDHQVKVRGYRVELGEVEAALAEHPRVRDAVVRPRRDAPAGRGLVAWVAAEEEGAELRRFLRRRLPEHMIPAAFVRVDALPRGAAGKVEESALPNPQTAVGEDYVAPRTPTEEIVAGVWSEVLRRERVGAHDDFFELGGHSLLATQVTARLRESFHTEIGLRSFFEAPTVAQQAEAVERAARAPVPPIRRAPRDRELPLSYSQERLWFLAQLEPESAAYHVPRAYRLRGRLDVAALERSYGELFRRHEVLRTVFPAVDGRPAQVILPPWAFRLPVVDLTAIDGERREAESERMLLDFSRRLFDLAAGPLLRAMLLVLGEEESIIAQTEHHLVHDGWAEEVLMGDLTAIYAAYSRGLPSPIPELAVQYADFAVWQRQWLRGEVLAGQLAYWREHLAGAPELLELPTDRPRPRIQGSRGGVCRIPIPGGVGRSLRELSRRRGTTLFMTALAAFYTLLYRFSGQGDVVIGTGVANRHRQETEGLLGMVINTLPLRARPGGDPRLADFLDHVRQVCLGAYAHQDVPFSKIVETLKPARSLSYAPVFQVMFAFHDAPFAEHVEAGDLVLTPVTTHNRSAKFDLVVILTPIAERRIRQDEPVSEEEERILGFWEYDSALFDRQTIERLTRCFEILLSGLAAGVDGRLSRLPLLSQGERRQVLMAWNDTRRALPWELPVHELFAAAARRRPDALAVAAGERCLSYGELEARANQLAHHLRARGVGPEVPVALCLERSPELILAILGVVKAGGVYVPLEPALPRDRLAFMIRDIEARLLLTGRQRADDFAGGVPLVALDRDRIAGAREAAPEVCVRGENLAYVIYTSGSTGAPKGVPIRHRSLLNLVAWHRRVYSLTPGDRAPVLAGIGFDASVWEIWPYLCAGASLWPLDGSARVAPEELVEWLAAHGITVAFLPTPLAEATLGLAWPSPLELRTLLTGGDRLRRHAPELGFELVNHYGPTESTVVATAGRVPPRAAAASPPAIGAAIDNVRVYVVDRHLTPAPAGAAGELVIAGEGLSRGYWRRPGMTAGSFVPDPWDEPGGRLYKSGDLVRWRRHGGLEFRGRIDHQIKIRGFRIEPGEIEHALARHPAVGQAAVVPTPAAAHLVAFVVGAGGLDAPAPRELHDFLAASLAPPMVPAAFVALEELPLTPNGKVDRAQLARRAAAEATRRVDARESFQEPRTPTEELIAGIWSRILGRQRVGLTDSFFELGGHSLLATQVASHVRQALGVEVPLRDLFHDPTVAGLARKVAAERAAGRQSTMPPLEALPPAGEAPLSFAQERMWFLHQLQPANPAYHIPLGVALSGELAVAALAASLGEVVRRHQVLRTCFPADAGRPRPATAPASPWPLPIADLTRLGPALRDAEARRLVHETARRPFDLARGPVMRTTLLRLARDRHVLALVMHHVVSDGWSMSVFVEEVAALYAAGVAGRPSPLAEPPLQYADFAAWQRSWLRGEELERQLGYWRDRLAAAPAALDLPTDRPRPAIRSQRGSRRHRTLGRRLTAELEAMSRGENVTLFMTLLAAWAALLSRDTGQDEVVVGSPIANRRHAATERLIGFFVNTLALDVEVAGAPTFRRLLGRTRELALAAYDHQDLPFERLVQELPVERDLSRSPVFQVMLILQNAPRGVFRSADLTLELLPLEIRTARFDLTLGFQDRQGRLFAHLEYDTDLFDAVTAERMLARFERLLSCYVRSPDASVAEASPLATAECHQALVEWNDVAASEVPEDLCAHQLFEAQAARAPEAVALVAAGRRLSYRELDLEADRLGRRLRAEGVGPWVRVAVSMARTADLVVALLAVWKTGGAYVPVDPAYPERRRRWMVDDAGAALVLADGAAPIAEGVKTLSAAAPGDGKPAGGAGAGDLSHVIYTSGSTGRPKGVAIRHRSVVALLCWARSVYSDDELAGVVASTSISFDLSVFELFAPLAWGGRVILIDDALALANLPGDADARLLNTVPSVVPEWLRRQSIPATVRTLNLAGEALPESLAREISAATPVRRLWNLYGPSEDTTYSTAARIGGGMAGAPAIGRPLPGGAAYLLDRRARPVAPGATGELHLAGPGLALGYLDRPAATAARFVPHPWSSQPGGRMYRTGDLARHRHGGELAFLGRADHQVKIRGFRIELGEIEAALLAHPEIRGTVVTARGGVAGAPRLVAYVVPAGAAPTLAGLQRDLGRTLPGHMLPNALVVLDELPLTPNGKIDRKRLPEPDRPAADKPFVAPRNPTEEKLAEIWCLVLDVEQVGVDDTFFELGGHSLLATQVTSRIYEHFAVQIPLQELFARPTVAALAERILQERLGETMDEAGKDLLERVESLSDEEIEAELARLRASA